MKRYFIRLIITLTLIGVGLISIVLGPILFYSSQHWPLIADPEKLRREASVLCQTRRAGEIPSAEWPQQIAALHPRIVFVDGEKVDIMISSGGISAQPWGYHVWPENGKRANGGISKYDTAREK